MQNYILAEDMFEIEFGVRFSKEQDVSPSVTVCFDETGHIAGIRIKKASKVMQKDAFARVLAEAAILE
jgi:uncharacterized protein YuzE